MSAQTNRARPSVCEREGHVPVGIWGSYAYGNYGDELMAVCFGRHVNAHGGRACVYGLDREVANSFVLDTSPDIRELIERSRLCVVGGGSLLSGGKPTQGAYAESKRREYIDLVAALREAACPTYFVSIGGDGEFTGALDIADYRESLLRSGLCRRATVRQAHDVPVMSERFGIPAQFHPDVVLGAAEQLGVQRASHDNGVTHIGLCVSESDRLVAEIVGLLAATSNRIIVHYFTTVRPIAGQHWHKEEFSPQRTHRNSRLHPYRHPISTMRDIAQLDLMITTKLHIGMTAVSMGIPYICVGKSLKCKAFLSSIGSPDAYWGDLPRLRRYGRIVRAVRSRQAVSALAGLYDFGEVERQKRASRRHLDFLNSIVSAH